MHVLAASIALAYPGFQEAKALEPAASFVAHRRTIVWCADSNRAWASFVRQRYPSGSGPADDVAGSADIAGRQLWLVRVVCKSLAYGVHKAPPRKLYVSVAPSVEALTHEAIHVRGETDEGATDCEAMHEMPRVAVKFFHVLPGRRLRALMAAAWKWHKGGPANYQTVC
jgi:hypothetical protein